MSKCIISILIVFIAFVFSHFSYAQRPDADSAKSIKTDSLYFKSVALFKCDIKLPENFNPDKNYTLVIGLHGGGSSPEAFIKIWDNVKDVDFIYAAPQGPYSILFDKLGNEWSLWSSPDLKLRAQAGELIDDYIADLVKELKEQYKIDNIYLLGFSQGAVFTYVAGVKNHHLFKGIICLSGPGISEPLGDEQFAPDWLKEKYLEPAKKLRVFIAHGTKDQRVEYELGVKSKEILNSYGYDVVFQSFDGGHKIYTETLKQALDWMNKK